MSVRRQYGPRACAEPPGAGPRCESPPGAGPKAPESFRGGARTGRHSGAGPRTRKSFRGGDEDAEVLQGRGLGHRSPLGAGREMDVIQGRGRVCKKPLGAGLSMRKFFRGGAEGTEVLQGRDLGYRALQGRGQERGSLSGAGREMDVIQGRALERGSPSGTGPRARKSSRGGANNAEVFQGRGQGPLGAGPTRKSSSQGTACCLVGAGRWGAVILGVLSLRRGRHEVGEHPKTPAKENVGSAATPALHLLAVLASPSALRAGTAPAGPPNLARSAFSLVRPPGLDFPR